MLPISTHFLPNPQKLVVSRDRQTRLAAAVVAFAQFKTACGCSVYGSIEPCRCEAFCNCELEATICRCEWPDEQIAELADLLCRLDPRSYKQPPSPAGKPPLLCQKRRARVHFRRVRFRCNLDIWHPSDSIVEALKTGCQIRHAANGEDIYLGVQEADPTRKCRFCNDFATKDDDLCSDCRTAWKSGHRNDSQPLKEAC